jgi:hypothetical protein
MCIYIWLYINKYNINFYLYIAILKVMNGDPYIAIPMDMYDSPYISIQMGLHGGPYRGIPIDRYGDPIDLYYWASKKTPFFQF